MNRTLLLILCDFLLLTLLALANWETAEPPATPPPASTADATEEGARTAAQDIVDVMQLSLADEQAARAELRGALDSTREELAAREQALAEREASLARLAAERAELDTSLQATRREAEAARHETGVTAERLAQLQRDLEAREAEARRRAEEVIQLERAQAAATARIQQLDVAVQVAEQEKTLLRQTADAYRGQVEVEREERQRAQATAAQLAESSREFTREIRDNRPINANTLYSEFVANRVPASFRLARSALLGPLTRATTPNTILVTDGTDTVALLHVDDTPINLREPPADWSTIEVALAKNDHRSSVPRLDFLSTDPRIVALPVNAFQVSALGAKVYQTALEPFKFPEAVLIANNGSGYGEVPFKLDPANPAYVRMDNRLVRRLFGDYSPSRGDLVLSKTGELLGIMVSNDVCALATNFLPASTLPTGDTSATPTSPTLHDLATRVSRLPGGR
jgi:hypothetical protein